MKIKSKVEVTNVDGVSMFHICGVDFEVNMMDETTISVNLNLPPHMGEVVFSINGELISHCFQETKE